VSWAYTHPQRIRFGYRNSLSSSRRATSTIGAVAFSGGVGGWGC
jgi:hypothetical protein